MIEMSCKTYTGRIVKLEAGTSSEVHCDILNIKFIRWRRNHIITPRMLPSTKVPVGYLQGHSFIEGEFGLTSECSLCFEEYIDDDGDNTIIPYFMITVEQIDKTTNTFTFNNIILTFVEKRFEGSGKEPVFVYRFLAYYVVRA